MSLSLPPRALLRLAAEERELEAEGSLPLALAGRRKLVAALARELAPGAEPGSIIETELSERVEAVVYVIEGEATRVDLRKLREAGRAHAPVVCIDFDGNAAEPEQLPNVLATDVIRTAAAEPLPVDELGGLLARRLEARSALLAARIPALRPGICKELTRRSARRSAAIGAAVFVPGADLPALFVEQARLVLRIGLAHGQRLEPARAAELAAVLAVGLGLRGAARKVRRGTLFPAWAVQGSIAYAGTLALGEAAARYFAAR